MSEPKDPWTELLGPNSTLLADLREVHQHLLAANERLRERREVGNRRQRTADGE